MAAGPNQTGSLLQSPVSQMMGYGQSLVDQAGVNEEEKRKKAQRDAVMASQAPGMGPQPLAGMFGG